MNYLIALRLHNQSSRVSSRNLNRWGRMLPPSPLLLNLSCFPPPPPPLHHQCCFLVHFFLIYQHPRHSPHCLLACLLLLLLLFLCIIISSSPRQFCRIPDCCTWLHLCCIVTSILLQPSAVLSRSASLCEGRKRAH